MLRHALVQIAGHLTELHEGTLHIAETFHHIFGRLQLKRSIEFFLTACIGKNSASLVCTPPGADLRSKTRDLYIPGGSADLADRSVLAHDGTLLVPQTMGRV